MSATCPWALGSGSSPRRAERLKALHCCGYVPTPATSDQIGGGCACQPTVTCSLLLKEWDAGRSGLLALISDCGLFNGCQPRIVARAMAFSYLL